MTSVCLPSATNLLTMSNMLSRLSPPALVIALGCLFAWWIQTDGGRVDVSDVRFTGANGNVMSALLYRPREATPDNPAPGVLAVHGYINSRETQSGFAIEFARRGMVVLALDQTGHGYSDPPAFAYGFGGPDGLAYLRSLPFVDKTRIGLEGHSMGGWTVQMAAASDPDGYRSMVLEGSSTGTFGAPEGTPVSPRNLLVVFSLFDEFSALMWETPVPANVVDSPKLQRVFGTDETIAPGRVYGDFSTGTARKLLMPPVTHPGDHVSTAAIGAAVDWFEQTLGVEGNVEGQRWYWKELATLVALLGLAWLVFPLLDRAISLAGISGSPRMLDTSGRWWPNALIAALVPVLTFFPLQAVANLLVPPTPVFAQQITSGVMLWALGNGALSLAGFWLWYRRRAVSLADLGALADRGYLIRVLWAGLIVVGALLLVVAAAEFLLNVDFRFWVVALKAPSAVQVGLFIVYLPFFLAFFAVLSLTLHSQLRLGLPPRRAMLVNGSVLSGGFVLLLLIQYIPLLLGGTLTIASQPLLTIVAFQFVPVLFFAGAVSTWAFEKTGSIYPGALVNALVITWYLVAGTATQAVPFWL